MRRSRRSPISSSPPAIRRRCALRAAATYQPPAASSNRTACEPAGRSPPRRRFRSPDRTPPVSKLLLGGLAAILLGYALLITALFFGQRSLLYLPDSTRPKLGPLSELGFREITLTTADGLSLLSWYRPPPEGAPMVAYFHGNGGNLGYRTNRMTRFAEKGLGVLLLEYRGYGGNPGGAGGA